MTPFLPGFIAGYAIGLFSAFALLLVVYAHREPPICGYQSLPLTRMPPPPMPECKPAREDVGGIDYAHLGMTGREEV